MKFTEKEIGILMDALQLAIDNGLADDYEDVDALVELSDKLSEIDS